MRAVARLNGLLLAGALAFVPSIALAQEAPATTNAPATESVGPSELQNFSLNGTVTRPADQPATAQPAPAERRAPAEAQTPTTGDQLVATPTTTRAAPPSAAPGPRTARAAASQPPPPLAQAPPAPEPLRQSQPSSSVTAALPTLNATGTGSATAAPAAAVDFAPAPGTLAPERRVPILPWLLAALALGLGGRFLFWRNRARESYAGGPQIDAFTAPDPQPAPRPAPAPPRAERAAPPAVPAPAPAPPASAGLVSARLRPWVEIGFNPTRCILNDQSLVVEFELELFNSGSVPARGVRVDAAIFNAGPDQDQEIGAFIADPAGHGDSVEIPPLKRLGLKTQVGIARDQVQSYEIAGKQVFLPVIAFNALYGWGGGDGQTSATYLLGRDTKAEKLGPFRIDLGPRIFRSVAARLLPTALSR